MTESRHDAVAAPPSAKMSNPDRVNRLGRGDFLWGGECALSAAVLIFFATSEGVDPDCVPLRRLWSLGISWEKRPESARWHPSNERCQVLRRDGVNGFQYPRKAGVTGLLAAPVAMLA